MSSINTIIFFLILAFAALFFVSVINARQTRRRLINQRLSQLKRKVVELEELSVALESLTGSAPIAKLIVEETIDTLKGMSQLSANSQTIELNLNNALERANELSSGSYNCTLYRIMQSDAQIARAQYLLGEAGRIVRKRQASELIEISQMTTCIEELAWAHLMVTVISLTEQGHKAISRGDILRGHAFYKKAQQAAMESTLPNDKRHKFIKEIGEIMSNKRKAISIQLMPESNFKENRGTLDAPQNN